MDAIRYPIGPFEPIASPTSEQRQTFIAQIPALAPDLRACVDGLTPAQLRMPYREGGWTVAQIVHHLADNDMNAVLRFKRALTENEPIASSYLQDAFAELPDYRETPIEESLRLLELLHARFHRVLTGGAPEQFGRKLRTEAMGSVTLDTALQRFVWHGRHHAAQIRSFAVRMGWTPGASQ